MKDYALLGLKNPVFKKYGFELITYESTPSCDYQRKDFLNGNVLCYEENRGFSYGSHLHNPICVSIDSDRDLRNLIDSLEKPPTKLNYSIYKWKKWFEDKFGKYFKSDELPF